MSLRRRGQQANAHLPFPLRGARCFFIYFYRQTALSHYHPITWPLTLRTWSNVKRSKLWGLGTCSDGGDEIDTYNEIDI